MLAIILISGYLFRFGYAALNFFLIFKALIWVDQAFVGKLYKLGSCFQPAMIGYGTLLHIGVISVFFLINLGFYSLYQSYTVATE